MRKPKKKRSSVTHTTVDKFGRVLLPKPVRERLGLHPGDTLDLVVREGTVVVTKVPPKEPGIAYRNGVPYLSGYEWAGDYPMEEAVDRMYEEYLRHKLGPWPE